MTQLASRALLNAMLALAVLVLVLAAAALSRPDTAVAARAHTADEGRDSVARQGESNARARAERRVRPAARKPHVRRRRLSRGLRAVRVANRLTGIPYVWGGASPRSGFDCSGLVQYVYGKLGISLPHYTVSQYRHGRVVSRSSLRAGDLVFFHGLNHVGIYAGRGKYIHAPSSGSTVRWASLASASSYDGARRIVLN
jgi:cell wall-associated NlpC family hydrolase